MDVRPEAVWSDAMAAAYDGALGPAVFQPHAAHVAAVVRGHGPSSVVELAAGTGRLTRCLLEALPEASVVATDVNPAMVGWGSAHVPAASWAVAPADALPVADASTGAVACTFGLMFFPDRAAAHAEALRVLAPGGALVHAVWCDASTSTCSAALVAALSDVFPDDPPDFVQRVPHGLGDPDLHLRELRAAGFVDAVADEVVLGAPAVLAADLAAGYCTGTPLRQQLQQRGDPARAQAQVTAAMVRRLGTGPVAGRLTALVVQGRRPG